MAGPWLDGYERVPNARAEGSAYADRSYYPYQSIILLHMTVSYGASRSYISGHNVPPHGWANPYNGDLFQTVRLDRAAYALYQPQYGYHWTNKHTYLLQTELVGVPQVSVATYSDDQCRWIAQHVVVPQAEWLASIGEPVDLTQVRYHTNTSGSASEYWSGRLSEQEMADYHGLMCHIDAWGNDHWDCSAERVDLIARYARELLGTVPPAAVDSSSRRRKVLRSMESTLRPGSGPGFYVMDLTIPKAGDKVLVRIKDPARVGNHALTVVWGNGNAQHTWQGLLGDDGTGKGPFDPAIGQRGLIDRMTAPAAGLCSVISPVELVLNLDPV